MTAASGAAHGLLLQHVVTPDGQLALPVDPAAISRAEGIDVPSVGDAYGLDIPEMARGFGVPWCQVRRRLAMLGLDDYCE